MPSLPPDEILRLLFSGKDEFDSETNLALTAKQFEEVVERVSARERMHQVSTAPLLRFLKANARHWSTLSGFREARAQLYRQVALAAVSSRALAQQKVSAAKLLLHLTSNSSPSELQSQFTFAFDQILACLGLQPFSPTKATLFHLKVLRVIIERGNTLSQTQVTKAAGTIARIALSSNATTTPSAPPSRSTNQTADNPFLSKELKHCRVKSKGYITSDSEDDDGAQRKTIDHQVKHLALVCVESLTRVR